MLAFRLYTIGAYADRLDVVEQWSLDHMTCVPRTPTSDSATLQPRGRIEQDCYLQSGAMHNDAVQSIAHDQLCNKPNAFGRGNRLEL